VSDVAVLGIKDEYSGEVPKAFIVPQNRQMEGHDLGMELINYVKEKKVKYKAIKEVEFIAEIPKSASGKILRRVLRDREKNGEVPGTKVREVKARM
jgi:4-coumarate--CoA ligase